MWKIPEPGTRCTIEAPCKINLHLRVKNRRPDGFHELESVFLALSFGDTLSFETGGDEGACTIDLRRPLPGGGTEPVPADSIPREKNLVYRAVSLFRERTGFRPGLRILLEKRVPIGAGFGGGSSDAAAALRALNRLTGGGLSRKSLGEMAESLGSDVPFFLDGGAALVTGRGEGIRRFEFPRKVSVVLVYPGFGSGTAEAFQLLDQVRGGGVPEVNPGTPVSRQLAFRELPALLGGNPAAWPFGNDFLPVFLSAGEKSAAAAYHDILDALTGAGADFSGLSGAGSGCFGIFIDGGSAERAVKELSRHWNFVRLTFPLARSGKAVLQ